MQIKSKKKNYNSLYKRITYFLLFLKYGILLNPVNGSIHYLSYSKKCKCSTLQIMRHGKTIGTEKKEFMSDVSANSKLSDSAAKEIESMSAIILKDLPDEIIVSKLDRTMDTYNILRKSLPKNVCVSFSEEMNGINNGVWEGKTFEMLDEEELYVFLQRECCHNVFYKSEKGDSWADVIYRCIKLLKKLNHGYKNKRVLLISQGSIYQGLKILLHIEQSPWVSYAAENMFNLSQNSDEKSIGYGCISKLL